MKRSNSSLIGVVLLLLVVVPPISVGVVTYTLDHREKTNLVELYKRVTPSIVTIKKLDSMPNQFSGTGFFVGPGKILTCSHVVQGDTVVGVVVADGGHYYGKVVKDSPEEDLALIEVTRYDLKSLVLHTDLPPPGTRVVSIGNPLDWRLRYTLMTGVVSGLDRNFETEVGTKQLVQNSCLIYPGNSGGPLMLEDGEVVGVTNATGYSGLSLAIPMSAVRRFLSGDFTPYTRSI